MPSRLIGATLTVQLSETEVDIFRSGTWVLKHPRSTCEAPCIDYRHVIDWLVRKPGAFRHYVHRECLFPDIHFRQAHAQLTAYEEARADKRYLKLLKLAADGSEAVVSEAIAHCLRAGKTPLPERVEKQLNIVPGAAVVTALQPYATAEPLRGYDRLVGREVPV